MAIELKKEIKRQRMLILVFLGIVLITAMVLWSGFFRPEIIAPKLPLLTPGIKKIEINWDILKNPSLEELQLLEGFPPLEEEIGRENPFTPY